MKRTQIYLDEDQDGALARRALAEGRTKSDLIREAVDRYLGRSSLTRAAWRDRWVAALDATAGAAPDLAPGNEHVAELRRFDLRRQQGLDELRDSDGA